MAGMQEDVQSPSSNDVTVGLDVSTSVVGVAVLADDGSVIELDCVDLRKLPGLWQKTDAVQAKLNALVATYGARIVSVAVEQNLSGFRMGFTSAATIQGLARFNGMTCLLARQTFGVDPVHVDFREARKALSITIVKSDVDVKEQIWSQVSERVDWEWPTRLLRSGPRKGVIEPDETRYDMADAYVVARARQLGISVTKKAKKRRKKT